MKHGLVVLSSDEVDAVEADLGYPIDVVQTTWNWNHTPTLDDWRGPTWTGRSGSGTEMEQKRQDMIDTFGGDRQLCMFYPISADDQVTYTPAIEGDFDAAWRSWGEKLVDAGIDDMIFRPNPEHNLDWGRYPSSGDPRDYADAFARFVREVTSVPGQNFDFVYSPAGHRLGITKDAWPLRSDFWPDGQQAPIFTPSWYDTHWEYPDCPTLDAMTQEEFDQMARDMWSEWLGPELQMWQDTADDLGARMGVIEWGGKTAYKDPPNNTECAAGNPGDNPRFIRKTFEFARENDWVVQAYWNTKYNRGGEQQIWPFSDADLPRASEAWFDEVRSDIESARTSIEVGEYATPSEGTTDWHVPLNENFARIEEDVLALADRLGATVTAGYAQPEEGTTDWHAPLNENFATIDSDVAALAAQLQNSPSVGGYAQPAEGTQDWHIPLNDNFTAIENDLKSIADMA